VPDGEFGEGVTVRPVSMVERVARAIYEADDVWSEAFPWPNMGSPNQSADEYRRIARAAIEAMREPTEAMVGAGWAEALAENANGVWSDMIDEALK